MAGQGNIVCSECGASLRQDAPLCAQCGKLPLSVVSKGTLALEHGDIPSQNARGELLRLLKSWFPRFDAIHAERRLKQGPAILIAGIDEETGDRLLDVLKSMKVPARLVDHRSNSWGKRVWNSGLIVSVFSLILAAIFRGPISFIFILLAGGAPLLGALLIQHRRKPLLAQADPLFSAEQWIRLSQDYSQVLKTLAPVDGAALKSFVTRVFEFQSRLRSASLASAAAGAETGELYKRLRDALRAGVDICRNIATTEGEAKEASKKELLAFEDQVSRIDEWYRSLENGGTKRTSQLVVELSEIVESIDRIVQEVRPPLGSNWPAQIGTGKVGE